MTRKRWLIAGDLAALLAFAVLGLATHEREFTAAALARSFLPFAVGWLLVGSVLGGFQPDAASRPVSGWGLLMLWLPAGVLGLVIRSMVFERALFTAFFPIALIGNGLFLLAWRTIYERIERRNDAGARAPGDDAPESIREARA
ncbi:MAG: DUF3054 domain-containing protein [Chloroflexi bacterium]|nr:MAG: DUF3054 domain-containing protein [Chloroflexota bacterium]